MEEASAKQDSRSPTAAPTHMLSRANLRALDRAQREDRGESIPPTEHDSDDTSVRWVPPRRPTEPKAPTMNAERVAAVEAQRKRDEERWKRYDERRTTEKAVHDAAEAKRREALEAEETQKIRQEVEQELERELAGEAIQQPSILELIRERERNPDVPGGLGHSWRTMMRTMIKRQLLEERQGSGQARVPHSAAVPQLLSVGPDEGRPSRPMLPAIAEERLLKARQGSEQVKAPGSTSPQPSSIVGPVRVPGEVVVSNVPETQPFSRDEARVACLKCDTPLHQPQSVGISPDGDRLGRLPTQGFARQAYGQPGLLQAPNPPPQLTGKIPQPAGDPASIFPANFPRFTPVRNINHAGAYLANASYFISLGGKPSTDLNYGIIVVPLGEEHLLFGRQPNNVMSASFADAVREAMRHMPDDEPGQSIEPGERRLTRPRFAPLEHHPWSASEPSIHDPQAEPPPGLATRADAPPAAEENEPGRSQKRTWAADEDERTTRTTKSARAANIDSGGPAKRTRAAAARTTGTAKVGEGTRPASEAPRGGRRRKLAATGKGAAKANGIMSNETIATSPALPAATAVDMLEVDMVPAVRAMAEEEEEEEEEGEEEEEEEEEEEQQQQQQPRGRRRAPRTAGTGMVPSKKNAGAAGGAQAQEPMLDGGRLGRRPPRQTAKADISMKPQGMTSKRRTSGRRNVQRPHAHR